MRQDLDVLSDACLNNNITSDHRKLKVGFAESIDPIAWFLLLAKGRKRK